MVVLSGSNCNNLLLKTSECKNTTMNHFLFLDKNAVLFES